jgi:hypothetical protein
MATKPLTSQVFRSILRSGKPNSLGTVDVYVAGTAFATRATIYSDAIKTSELTNPVTLSSAGEIEMWFEVDVDYRVWDSGANSVRDILAVPAQTTVVSTGNYNLLANGSAELDTDTDTLPDDWTLALETSGTITVSTTQVAHGKQSFKFTGSGNGAGTATSEKFDVLEAELIDVQFTYRTDAATSTNSVKIKWYTKADAIVSTTTVYSGTTGQPAAFTTYNRSVAAPATATRGELILGGIENGGTVETGTTYFDNVIAVQANQYSADSLGNPIVYDGAGNEIIRTTAVANAVNEVNITNSATGNPVPIVPTGGDTNIGVEITAKGVETVNINNALKATNVASDVNEITVTSATTGNRPTISTSGEADIGLDFENDQGEEMLELVATPTAVNNIRITNAITGSAAIIDCSETDGDVELTRNGTGDITVDSTPVYGMVVLDEHTNILNSSNTDVSTWTAVSAGAAAVALKAIIRITATVASTTGGIGNRQQCVIYVRSPASTSSPDATTRMAWADHITTDAASEINVDTNTFTVNLDSSGELEYQIEQTQTGTESTTARIDLVGYYA